MTPQPQKQVVTTETQEQDFQIVIGEESVLPAIIAETEARPTAAAGGLSYQSATPEERAEMDKVIASIDLTNSDTIVALGSEEREQLATLADQILDSVQPSVKLAFVEALKALIDTVKENSLDAIKERIADGTFRRAGKAFWNAVRGRDSKIEASKETIEKFMTDISDSRKTITEMTDKLMDQKVELEKNFDHINELGKAITLAAQRMRIVRAATVEYMEHVATGKNDVLEVLEAKANQTGRADDMEKLQLAQTNWNNLRTVDADLLGSINVYDMNVANLAFTKQANVQNRIQTATTLTTTIAEWKTGLAIFAVVTTNNAAAQLLNAAGELTEQSIKQNKDMFDTLVDSITQRVGKGTYDLRQIMEAQNSMAKKLETVGTTVEAQFEQLAKDKEALEKSSAEFRRRVTNVYSKNNGAILKAPKPKM